ncbi:phosphatase PAP2 family protein [Pedobacter psychroterrae]|uniref:Phosphatase PAP2 family protein n=2 Tax=Pedobacter psychroterrae TaxID=2530453 RepID=A0A4R0NLR4_9SPHI|nr:phosphatase PAP2 family protein [Pedobacter psychroterrae]
MKKLFYCCVLLFFICSCKQEKTPVLSNNDIVKVIDAMTEMMIHDVTNPPLAARFFSYACLSGYEVVALNDSNCVSMDGILNDFPKIVRPLDSGKYNYQLSAVLAMIATAKKMQPSGSNYAQFEEKFLDSCRNIGFSDKVIKNSKSYAMQVSKQILGYAKKDRYNRISNYPRYTPLEAEGSWYPTPPAFFAPVEPYFSTVRPFMLDSSSQFKPVPPVPFSKDKNSEFYKMLVANYKIGGTELSEDHREIAAFWDCNPFALKNEGHLLVGMKKISPGAHWLGITGIACRQSKLGFSKSMEVFSMVSFGLMDSFLGCWDEKFRSNRIRPETAIRNLIDPKWKPLLQTPPFPEYLSGHSCISSTSATILTHYFGDNYQYTDNVEVKYGLKERSFTSFNHAAQEAGISRFYGGIHFMDAIDNGMKMGNGVGKFIIEKLKTKQLKQPIKSQS